MGSKRILLDLILIEAPLFSRQSEDGIELYLADYPERCRDKLDPTMGVRLNPTKKSQLAKFLKQQGEWHPYCRILGQYSTLKRNQPARRRRLGCRLAVCDWNAGATAAVGGWREHQAAAGRGVI